MAAALAAAGGGAGAAAASGAANGDLYAAVNRTVALAGPRSGIEIYDMTAGQLLYAAGAELPRPPASVEKVFTAVALLQELGPSAQLSTAVLGNGWLGGEGTWHGDLYLRGGGDPTFGSAGFIRSHYDGAGASVSDLAAELRHAAGIRHVTGRVIGDDSLFDDLRGGPSTGYRPDIEITGNLSALAFDRGQQGKERGPHAPAAYAALQLRRALARSGVEVDGGAGAGITPSGAHELASVPSPPLATLLGLMLQPSDNFFAEMLLKVLGARFGAAGTTAAGAAVVQSVLDQFGIHPVVVDGSGLSREDHASPHQIAGLLAELTSSPIGAALRGALPVAGESGTLKRRMRATPARGRCTAKTGTLDFDSDLAGYCDSVVHHTIVFSLEMEGLSDARARELQDSIAITLARYTG